MTVGQTSKSLNPELERVCIKIEIISYCPALEIYSGYPSAQEAEVANQKFKIGLVYTMRPEAVLMRRPILQGLLMYVERHRQPRGRLTRVRTEDVYSSRNLQYY